jgi:hypothetical protein
LTMAYTQRYGGGFLDSPSTSTPVDSTFLNAVEAALLKLFAVDTSADGQALLWKLANGRYEPALISNANIDPAAAIAKSKLAALGIVDADIAGGAAIAASKLAGNIPANKLSGFPNIPAQVFKGDGSWGLPAVYRKNTQKQVVNSVAETDLLNGEITIAAGVMTATGVLRLTAWGDAVNNSGSTQNSPKLRLKLGGTTLIDTSAIAAAWTTSSSRFPWKVTTEITNLGATGSQWVSFVSELVGGIASNLSAALTAGEGAHQALLVAAGTGVMKALAGVSGAIDTTIAQALALSVILPAASANVDMTLKGAIVELV